MRKKQSHSLQFQFFYPNYYDRCTITGEIKCSVAPPSAGGGGGTEASCHAPRQAFLVPSSHIVTLARLPIGCLTKGDSANVKGAVFREQRGGGLGHRGPLILLWSMWCPAEGNLGRTMGVPFFQRIDVTHSFHCSAWSLLEYAARRKEPLWGGYEG